MHSEFLISAAHPSQFPGWSGSEVAVVGRSNCGKSSLLNSLMNRRDLVRVSRTPGRTQLVNFFKLNKDFLVVDLPGYGFSATGMQTREIWADLVKGYFEGRKISRILFLVDCRRPLADDDRNLLDYLGNLHRLCVVLTKVDKLNQSEQNQCVEQMKSTLRDIGHKDVPVLAVSTLKNLNIDRLRKQVFVG
jgi:GTP-binding protein